MLDLEDVEKISEFTSIWSDKNPFSGLAKTWAAVLHKFTFVWKNVQNGGYSLNFFFKASWLHAWKILGHLKLYNI